MATSSEDSDLAEDIEDENEVYMDMDEIRAEEGKTDSNRIQRCRHCKRMTFGHEGPYGEGKCSLDPILDLVKLKEDDARKNKRRADKREKNETYNH